MKERPIIFSAPMVRAILAGTKVQTRRVVKLKPWQQIEERDDGAPWPWMYDDNRAADHWVPCPYGQPGGRLWVREAWAPRTLGAWPLMDQHMKPLYRASEDRPEWKRIWKPSIHMPRLASRILLDVTAVRVERLQDISEADAQAEGITPKWEPGCSGRLMDAFGGFSFRPAASAYAELWEQINGPGAWDANPWVWVVEFKRVTA